MAYNLYPAVDEVYNFPPEIRTALAKSLELRNDVEPMTTTVRNNLLPAELWDGRTIANTTTDHLERYDAGTSQWKEIAEGAELDAIEQKLVVGPIGFRNVIRNGDMQIRQRGNGTFVGSNVAFQPTLDGWKTTHSGGTLETSWYTTNNGLAGGVSEANGVIGIVLAGSTGASQYAHLSQAIESVLTFAGTQVTVSFVGYMASGGTAKVGVQARQLFGTGGSPSSQVEFNLGTVTMTSTPTKYSVTATLPGITGKTLGTNGDHSLQLVLWLSAGSSNSAAAGGVPLQNGTFCFTDVQMEAGPVATPFERIPRQQQLAWCSRYFQQYNPCMALRGVAAATNNGTNLAAVLPVPMRVPPTFASSGQVRLYNGSAIANVSSWIGIYTHQQEISVDAQLGTASFAVGNVACMIADTGVLIALSAEL